MDIDGIEQLANAVLGWDNCTFAWLDTSEDTAAAVVGAIDDDGNSYLAMIVDCDQYMSGDSLALDKYYASVNPSTVLALIKRVRDLETMGDKNERLRRENSELREILSGEPQH